MNNFKNEIFICAQTSFDTYKITGEIDKTLCHHFQNWADLNGIKVTTFIPAEEVFKKGEKQNGQEEN